MADASEPVGDPDVYALAYSIGRAAVDGQVVALKDARDRASTLMTTAAAVATIAVGLAFRDETIDLAWWGILGVSVAVVGFLAVATATVAIWRPLAMGVNVNAGTIVTHYAERPEDPMTVGETHAELALWLGQFTSSNADAIARRLKWFSWGLVGLALETGGLTTMLMNVATR